MAKTPDNSPLFLEDLAPWNENANPIWLATTLLLHRNMERFNFPTKLEPEKRKQLVALIGKELPQLSGFDQPSLLKSEDCTPVDKEFLVEHCLTHEGFLQALQGEAFVFDKHGFCLLTINIEDHLHFHYIDVKGEIEKGWKQIVGLESQIGKTLGYSYSSKFGYLTSNPLNSGTGLSVSTFLQVSGLLHSNKLKDTFERLKDEAVEVSGLMGKPGEFIGDLVVISNQYSLGVNEEGILAGLRNFTTKILAEENILREQIKQQESAEIKDKVARAYGILIHSYQMETVEALNEIALLKLGLSLGWIEGITMKELNKLFFSCRRAHLLRTLPEKIPLEQVGHRRAELIHAALKNVSLKV